MLENKLHDIPYILLLRSDRILKDLLENESDDNSHSLDEAIEDFYPNKFRKESLNQAYHPKCRSGSKLNSLDYSFDCLDNLYDEYFKQDGSIIYAKPEKLDRYSSIINKIHPFNIVGYHLANKLANREIYLHTIEELAGNISPLGFSVGDGKRYSDNHVHLFGVKESSVSIWHIFNNKFIRKVNDAPKISDLSLRTLRDIGIVSIEAIYKLILYKEESIFKDTNIQIKNIISNSNTAMVSDSNYLYFLSQIKIGSNRLSNEQNLLRILIKKHDEKKFSEALFILNVFFFYIYTVKENKELQKFIKIFLHCSNLIRSHLVMGENIGLGYFVKYFAVNNQMKIENYKNLLENNEYSILTDIFKNGTTSLEAKISPNYLSIEKYKNNFQKKTLLGTINPNFTNNNIHFSIHFTRNINGVKKNIKEMKKIYEFLYKKNTIQDGIDYSKLIRSIDVAGNENNAPPENFAPIINYLRYAPKVTKKSLSGHKIIPHKKLRLSVHAGEDFNHIVTGMRRVDETIYYYSMENKDRLGHALAVGLEPKQWLEANGDIIMTKKELLDNFVWLKRKAKEVSNIYPAAKNLICRYDKYIQTLSHEIYGNSISTTADELYDAWKLRRNDCELFFEDNTLDVDTYKKASTPDKNNFLITDQAKEIFKLTRSTVVGNTVRDNGAEIVYVQYEHFSENHSYLKITDEDLELYRVVQDYMLNMIASKNIFIEACPTSNIYISHLSKYENHPIFRWHPIDKNVRKNSSFRKGIVQVCVNTDDPAIMPTNLPTEFEHLRLAGKKLGYDNYSIDTWLEELREFGNEIFDDNHEDIKLKS